MDEKIELEKDSSFDYIEKRIVNRTRKEQYVDVDEAIVELEKNKELVRMDMNTVELPIFSKNTRRKKNETMVYYLKTDKSAYLEVEPAANYSIPGDFEEKTFIALTKIMRDNGYENKTFCVTASEILANIDEKLKTSGGMYAKRLKQAMVTLAKTRYTFKNSLYSFDKKGIIEDEIHTPIMSIRIITRKDKKSNEIDFFEDGRVKEVYEVSFSKYFYSNIITKGYMVYDTKALLGMNSSITRALYIMIEKWRGYDLYLKRPAFFIARRIPLAWNKRNITQTINQLKKASEELKSLGLIEGYKHIKEKKLELSEFEFIFNKEHNEIKRETNYDERRSHAPNFEVTEQKAKLFFADDKLKELIKQIPPYAQTIKTLPKVIEDVYKTRGYEFTLNILQKTIKIKPRSFRAYFIKLADNSFKNSTPKEKLEEKQNKPLKKEQEKNNVEEAQIINETNKYWDIYLSYSEEEREQFKKEYLDSIPVASKKYIESAMKKGTDSLKTIMIEYIKDKNISEKIVEKVEESKEELHIPEEKSYNKKDESYIIEIENEFKNPAMFLLQFIKIAKSLNLKAEDYEPIKEVMPMLNELGNEINIDIDKYNVYLSYFKETLMGTIKIKEI